MTTNKNEVRKHFGSPETFTTKPFTGALLLGAHGPLPLRAHGALLPSATGKDVQKELIARIKNQRPVPNLGGYPLTTPAREFIG
jgi:hypothetical protein